MKKIAFFILLVGGISSCNNKTSDKTRFHKLTDLQEKVFKYGDKKAYEDLKVLMLDYPTEDFLFWSLIMANKHNSSQAYLDVFSTIVLSYVGEIDRFYQMDKRSRDFAMEYL